VFALLWRLPALNRLSATGRGAVEAGFGIGTAAVAALIVISFWRLAPTPSTSSSLAQIGATLLVAYGVETNWLLKRSHVRSKSRQSWVGFASGIAFCGLFGIGTALALASEPQPPHTFAQHLLLAWTLASFFFLGTFVALSPSLVYEWTHQLNTDPPDE
jgi:hypothetical protein